MDPRDPTERPSIFRSPEPIDEPDAPRHEPPARPIRSEWPSTTLPPPQEPSHDDGPSRPLLIGLGAGGILLLALGGFVVANVLSPDENAVAVTSPSASPSPTSMPSASISSTAPTPSPSPTPAPTPAGPPQDVAVGSWATVAVDELTVRAGAGTDSASNYILVRGAVVTVAEGPVVVADLNWYRVASLGGAVGWVTSGWVAEPFLTTLVEDPILIRCGEVKNPVFDVVNGAAVPRDPLLIGDLALPVAAFSERGLGAMELLRGTGQDACITAQLNASGMPIVTSQLNGNACGRVARDGALFRLRPATGQNVPPEIQVKDPLVLHPAVLTSVMVGDPMAANLRTVAELIAAGTDATGCIYVSVQAEADGVKESTSIWTEQCFIVSEQMNDVLTLAASDGGGSKNLLLSPGASSLEIGVPIRLSVNVGGSDGGTYTNVYQGYGSQGC